MARSSATLVRSKSSKASSSAASKPTAKAIGLRPKTYRGALNYLEKLNNYEQSPIITYNTKNFNLSRMHKLMAAMGNPHRSYRTCHIAGTKGKGSTATMLAELLHGSGHKVGLYTSPHILSVRERIAVDGQLISEEDFASAISSVVAAANKSKLHDPTYFEVLTAAAFHHFAEVGVQIAVLETGLGGRLDCTNICEPDVCGITNISYDHIQQLGPTLERIASEKAGIIKEGVPVFSAPQAPNVRAVLQKFADEKHAELKYPGEEGLEISYRFESSDGIGPHTRLCLTTPTSKFEHIHVPLLGDHQALNCALALSMADSLKARGVHVDEHMATEGLSHIALPGRMEMISERPRILVDGAHNAASVEALMRAIGQNIPYDSMVVIFGCRRDKDVMGMLRHIQLGADKIIFTSTGSPRSMSPAELAIRYSEISGKMAQVAEDLEKSLAIARAAVSRDDLICITGSFYLVGCAKRLFGAGSGDSTPVS